MVNFFISQIPEISPETFKFDSNQIDDVEIFLFEFWENENFKCELKQIDDWATVT